MSVYVDDAFVHGDWGKWTGGGHMQADTAEELHEFAARLGLKREWFQSRPNRPELDHYDLTRSKRAQALKLGGVIEEDFRGAARRTIARMEARESPGPLPHAAGESKAPAASDKRAITQTDSLSGDVSRGE